MKLCNWAVILLSAQPFPVSTHNRKQLGRCDHSLYLAGVRVRVLVKTLALALALALAMVLAPTLQSRGLTTFGPGPSSIQPADSTVRSSGLRFDRPSSMGCSPNSFAFSPYRGPAPRYLPVRTSSSAGRQPGFHPGFPASRVVNHSLFVSGIYRQFGNKICPGTKLQHRALCRNSVVSYLLVNNFRGLHIPCRCTRAIRWKIGMKDWNLYAFKGSSSSLSGLLCRRFMGLTHHTESKARFYPFLI